MSKAKNIIGALPAGNYVLGDPCYIHSLSRTDARWSKFLEAYDALREKDSNFCAVFEFEGHLCFVSDTNCGDGFYTDNIDGEYGVDAGMIAAIPVALCAEYDANGGDAFLKPVKVGATKGRWNKTGKRIFIGNRTIRT